LLDENIQAGLERYFLWLQVTIDSSKRLGSRYMDWDMTLGQLANLGEFLGGVVVVISVVYVAAQLRDRH
jgi:hypothetical protein